MTEINELEEKYLVLKKEDLRKRLTEHSHRQLAQLVDDINTDRKLDGKHPPKYVVLNLADKIDITKLGCELYIKENTPQKIVGDYHHTIVTVEDIAVDLVNAILKAKGDVT